MLQPNIETASTRDWVMLGNKKVILSAISVGMTCRFHSGMGGLASFRCTSIHDDKAEFTPVDPYWSSKGVKKVVDLKIKDFEFAEFIRLQRFFEDTYINERMEFSELLEQACLLGYAFSASWTQYGWTEFGCVKFREALQRVVSSDQAIDRVFTR